MKKCKPLITFFLAIAATLILTSCDKEPKTVSPYIDGLSISNYPVIDGSTSTLPLNTVIACELMGLNYHWKEVTNDRSITWYVKPNIKGSLKRKFDKVVKSSQTHNSIINLIDHQADLVLSARTLSPDEKEHARKQGVEVIETPIALDAFIFIINPRNSVSSLTIKNIQDIYTGKITDWSELGFQLGDPSQEGNPIPIYPFIRNKNSGSQELMDKLVMKGLEYYTNMPVYKEQLVFTMAGIIDEIVSNPTGIGYTIYYYNEQIIRPGDKLKTVAIDGIQPTKETISNATYPLTTQVYAIIRSDTDKSSMTYKIYEWLQTQTGKQAIAKSGYITH